MKHRLALLTAVSLSPVVRQFAHGAEQCLKVMTFDWSATLIVDPAKDIIRSS